MLWNFLLCNINTSQYSFVSNFLYEMLVLWLTVFLLQIIQEWIFVNCCATMVLIRLWLHHEPVAVQFLLFHLKLWPFRQWLLMLFTAQYQLHYAKNATRVEPSNDGERSSVVSLNFLNTCICSFEVLLKYSGSNPRLFCCKFHRMYAVNICV